MKRDMYEDTKIEEGEIEINVIEIALRLCKFWWLIALGVIIGTSCAWLYTTKCITPLYEASSMVYMRGDNNNANSAAALQELQVNTELTNDYEVIFKSRPIMQKVIKALELKMTYKQLAAKVQISNLTDTRILKVTIKDANPKLAKDIVNQIVVYGMESVKEIDAKEPFLVEDAVEDHDRVGPNVKMNIGIGGIIGFMFMVGMIILQYIVSDKIVTSDDIEKYLNLPVLCEIAEDRSFNYQKKRGYRGNGKTKKSRYRKC